MGNITNEYGKKIIKNNVCISIFIVEDLYLCYSKYYRIPNLLSSSKPGLQKLNRILNKCDKYE